MITKYGQLKSAIAKWLARNDLEEQIEDFIWLAESRINKDLQCPEMYKEKTSTALFVLPDAPALQVPENMSKLKSISYIDLNGNRLPLIPAKEQIIYQYNYVEPKYYERRGSYFTLYPKTITQDMTFSIQYYERVPSLSKANTSNWLIEQSPEIYLYASLLEACPYLGEDSRIDMWLAAYNIGVTSLNATSNNKQYGEFLDYTYYGGP